MEPETKVGAVQRLWVLAAKCTQSAAANVAVRIVLSLLVIWFGLSFDGKQVQLMDSTAQLQAKIIQLLEENAGLKACLQVIAAKGVFDSADCTPFFNTGK